MRQPGGGGAYQPLTETERRREPDEAAERDGTAARQERVAEQGDDEGSRPHRLLAAEARNELGGGNGGRLGHAPVRVCAQQMTHKN